MIKPQSLNPLSVPPLCSAKYLYQKLYKPQLELDKTKPNQLEEKGRVVPIDGSWFMPNVSRDPYQEFQTGRIKESRYFNIDQVSDSSSSFPHMLASPTQFENYMNLNNISHQDHIVVYDSLGIFSSCRVFWNFKVFGLEKVSLLQGGLPNWLKHKYPVVDTPFAKVDKEPFQVQLRDTSLLVNYDSVFKLVVGSNPCKINILDARAEPRFNGSGFEPRANLSSGHMPHSINLPFQNLLTQVDGVTQFQPTLKLNQYLSTFNSNYQPKNPTITSCGSGVTASILYFALKYAQFYPVDSTLPNPNFQPLEVKVYDGSWSEYASYPQSPILKL